MDYECRNTGRRVFIIGRHHLFDWRPPFKGEEEAGSRGARERKIRAREPQESVFSALPK